MISQPCTQPTQGNLSEAKVLVEAGRESLDGLSDVDPSVSASVFYVASLLAKVRGACTARRVLHRPPVGWGVCCGPGQAGVLVGSLGRA